MTAAPDLRGTACSAGVQVKQSGALFSLFVKAIRPPGETQGRPAGASSGKIPPGRRDQAGGCMVASGCSVCVGGLGAGPDGGAIRAEMADGRVHERRAAGGCCLVFAPVTSPRSPTTR